MHRIIMVLAAIMILFGSIVASQAVEKQNPGGTGGGGARGQPTTTAPKQPTTTAPKEPVKSDVCSLPASTICPPNASSCTTTTTQACCTAPAGNQKCGPVLTPAQCAHGYYGASCAECPGGAAAPCHTPNGTCSEGIGGTGACACSAGYNGPTCQYNCATLCNGNGVCSYNGSCTCNAGYTGPTCETKTTN
jgi:hypothetical protein